MSLALNLVLNQLPRFRRFGLVDRAALRREALARMQAFDIRAAGRTCRSRRSPAATSRRRCSRAS
jgi:hypothetical protein